MEASYQGGVIMDDRTDKFYQLSETVASNIKKISQNVSSMTKMVNLLQTPQDSQELRNQLRQIQTYTQKLVKDTSGMLMALMKVPTDQPAHKLSRDRLSEEYMTTLNAFQDTQKAAAEKSKDEMKVRAKSIHVTDPFALGSLNKDPEPEVAESNLKKQEQLTLQTERDLLQLEEMERDIRQLENDIVDVNQIFSELGAIIYQQGAVVDSIESNVEFAAEHVESGREELQQAANYKNKLRKKRVYLTIILVIVVLIILIIIFRN